DLPVAVGGIVTPREQREDHVRIEMAHRRAELEAVATVAEALCVDHLGAVPAPVRTRELQVQPAAAVDPDVPGRVREVVGARPDGLRARLRSPRVPGELDRSRGMPAGYVRIASRGRKR